MKGISLHFSGLLLHWCLQIFVSDVEGGVGTLYLWQLHDLIVNCRAKALNAYQHVVAEKPKNEMK